MTNERSNGTSHLDQLRRTAKLLLPPLVIHLVRRAAIVRRSEAEWEHRKEGWPTELSNTEGWRHQSIVAAQVAKWHTFRHLVDSSGPLGVSHEATHLSNSDLFAHNSVMTFGYVLGLVATGSDRVSVLDWGGGLGHFFLFASSLFPDLELDYHSSDLPMLAEAGARLLPDVTFHSADANDVRGTYDLVMANTSLQYSKHWKRMLSQLASLAKTYLFITGVPVVEHTASFVVTQRPRRYGYETEYCGWFINKHELLRVIADEHFELVREFVVGARPPVRGAPEQGEYQGYLFRRSVNSFPTMTPRQNADRDD
jgi:putative methyltransferase (TIGR04325 family)